MLNRKIFSEYNNLFGNHMLNQKIFSEENSPAFRSAVGRSEREGMLSSTTTLFGNDKSKDLL